MEEKLNDSSDSVVLTKRLNFYFSFAEAEAFTKQIDLQPCLCVPLATFFVFSQVMMNHVISFSFLECK